MLLDCVGETGAGGCAGLLGGGDVEVIADRGYCTWTEGIKKARGSAVDDERGREESGKKRRIQQRAGRGEADSRRRAGMRSLDGTKMMENREIW